MEEEKNIGVGSFNIIESLYQPIKDQEKLFGDRKYNFFKENNVDKQATITIGNYTFYWSTIFRYFFSLKQGVQYFCNKPSRNRSDLGFIRNQN